MVLALKKVKKESLASLRRQAKAYGVNTLLTVGGNAKIVKGDKEGVYLTAIMHLAPAKESGYNMCAGASKGCIESCLYASGRAEVFAMIKESRIARTILYIKNRKLFLDLLKAEIEAFIRKAKREGVKPAIRLNGTSDVVWEKIAPELFSDYPEVIYYDYTKLAARFNPNWELPKNYYILFSRSESNDAEVKQVLEWGGNVAVVFDELPETYLGRKVVDGDITDLRFDDESGIIVGLKAKGKAKKDTSGFVVKIIDLIRKAVA